jgi:hypothetical protein
MEHRWGERFTIDLAVKIAARPYAVRHGRLLDLSVSGGLIEVSTDLRRLMRVQVAFAMPNRFPHPVPLVSAYVTRKFHDCIGVEWSELAPAPVRELLRAGALHRRELLARSARLRPDLEASLAEEPALKSLSL